MFEVPQQPAPYSGPESRKSRERRDGVARREQYRFEPGKQDRRDAPDRRKHTGWDGRVLR